MNQPDSMSAKCIKSPDSIRRHDLTNMKWRQGIETQCGTCFIYPVRWQWHAITVKAALNLFRVHISQTDFNIKITNN